MAENYGWALADIRDLDTYDFWVHVRLCLIRDAVEKEFSARIAGALPSKGKAAPVKKGGGPSVKKIYQRFDPTTGRLLGDRYEYPDVRES